ncbi:hypothetical protein TRIATDRAFT_89787 [Trichoderma atroviride IMI 206040]|uniref:Uncharacterized protein n=1 Tax=Hypocrea atroviridis (strain ATCC 20476 / IMI 206040) TaxID=452589 RepID=G9NSK6_HYPAI|nr:uncharacterized protein TRIATDRAFT_89787 [Trichoderma atroviride IMI 206040]EHK46403.1 hypothetical protein TRIATDRAFT_89787 [Trichoderma atroviride IMI 206040]
MLNTRWLQQTGISAACRASSGGRSGAAEATTAGTLQLWEARSPVSIPAAPSIGRVPEAMPKPGGQAQQTGGSWKDEGGGTVGLPGDERGSGDAARPQGASVDPPPRRGGPALCRCPIPARPAGELLLRQVRRRRLPLRGAGAAGGARTVPLRLGALQMLLTCIHARLAWRTDLDARATLGGRPRGGRAFFRLLNLHQTFIEPPGTLSEHAEHAEHACLWPWSLVCIFTCEYHLQPFTSTNQPETSIVSPTVKGHNGKESPKKKSS